MSISIWKQCLNHLKEEYGVSEDELNMWLRTLHAELISDELHLLAPNRFVRDWVNERFINQIQMLAKQVSGNENLIVTLKIGSLTPSERDTNHALSQPKASSFPRKNNPTTAPTPIPPGINKNFSFETFVRGPSNELAWAAAFQVAENPGGVYNPLLLYGDVGLGKTHLARAVVVEILKKNPQARVCYAPSERFVADMVKALQRNTIDDFKRYYRSLNVLVVDDIQFFAGKERSQQEFFHTFNALLDGQQQIVLTSDRYPKELEGLEERLKSRLAWGLTAGIDPPELETSVAILKSKAEHAGVTIPDEVAFFIAERIKSNVRELEGALKRVIANSKFTGQKITLEFVREALKDLLALQAKLITIDNIQRVVAKYYKLRVADLLSKRRNRSITRPRQVAMSLSKVLTERSLPEIGDAFGGRDHTTVLHACRKIKSLLSTDPGLKEDYDILMRLLSA